MALAYFYSYSALDISGAEAPSFFGDGFDARAKARAYPRGNGVGSLPLREW